MMTTDASLWGYMINAGFVVKCVMLILLIASVASWSVIFERWRFYKKQWQQVKQFRERFWSGVALGDLYQELSQNNQEGIGLAKVFIAGFQTFSKLQTISNQKLEHVIDGTQRAMHIAESKTLDQLEQPLSLLATIGSVSPYIGLFGTVWGIMTAFQALGTVQQASIAMVAPGISEALIATALGLFAAIPAVIAYNRFTNEVTRLQNDAEIFSAELIHILQKATWK